MLTALAHVMPRLFLTSEFWPEPLKSSNWVDSLKAKGSTAVAAALKFREPRRRATCGAHLAKSLGETPSGPHADEARRGQTAFLGVKERGQVFKELIQTRGGTTTTNEFDCGGVVTDVSKLDVGHVLLPSFPMFLVCLANGPILKNQHGNGFELAS